MKTNESTITRRAGLPVNRKRLKTGMSVRVLLCVSCIPGLLPSLGLPVHQMAQAQAIRGEAIGAPLQTNSVSATNPPSRVKPSVTNTAQTDGIASNASNTNAPGKTEGFVKAGFDTLSNFRFELTSEISGPIKNPERASEKIREQIPASVKALGEKQVATEGFMLPLRMKDGLAVDFLLLRNQTACCYGGIPAINEWIQVRTTGKGVKPVMDEPITVFGTLHVGEIIENGYLSGIYQMDCQKVEAPSSQ